MKNNYTEENINEWFKQMKELPEYMSFTEVSELVDKGLPSKSWTNKFKKHNLKIIIMTTISIITLTYFIFFWTNPDHPHLISEEVSTIGTEHLEPDLTLDQNTAEERLEITSADLPIPQADQKKVIPTSTETKVEGGKSHFQRETNDRIDTLKDGKALIIELSDQELRNLGFLVDSTGIYYHNYYRGERIYFHARYEKNEKGAVGEITSLIRFKNQFNKKEAPSNLDFYPVAISNMLYTPSSILTGKYSQFPSINDTLVPVHIRQSQLKYGDNDKIFWFTPTTKFFSSLPNRYSHLEITYNQIKRKKRSSEIPDLIKYHPDRLVTKIPEINLALEDLEKLGFRIENQSIKITANLCDDNLTLGFKKGGVSATFHDSIPNNIAPISFVFVSDEFGQQCFKMRCKGDPENKLSDSYFMQQIEYLVPIVFKQKNYPNVLNADKIFWYKPSEELFALLPPNLSADLKSEFELVSGAKSDSQNPTNCNYFEACRSTLRLDEFKVFPNPASQGTTVQFKLDQPIEGRISLANIAGQEIKLLKPQSKFESGLNRHYVDFEGVKPGIYLIAVQSKVGFKTHRIIILQ